MLNGVPGAWNPAALPHWTQLPLACGRQTPPLRLHMPVVNCYLCLSPLLPADHLPMEGQDRVVAEPRAPMSSWPASHSCLCWTRLCHLAAAVSNCSRPCTLPKGLTIGPFLFLQADLGLPGSQGSAALPALTSCPQRLLCSPVTRAEPQVWVETGSSS